MKFSYCPDCGSILTSRNLGDEVNVPWCDSCDKPWFPVFPTAVIVLVYNDRNEVLVLRQDYISTQFRNLVSGYIVPGENAESCARREVKEETGIDIDSLQPVLTSWFDKKEILMIGFFAHASNCDIVLSEEVDEAEWISEDKFAHMLSQRPESAARKLAKAFLERKIKESYE